MEPDFPRRVGPEAHLTAAWRKGGQIALFACVVLLCFAHDVAGHDLGGHVEILHHPPDDPQLLGILAAEVGAICLNRV